MKTLKLDRPIKASKQVAVRFTPDEYTALKDRADKAGVPLATMLRFVGGQIIKGEIVVN